MSNAGLSNGLSNISLSNISLSNVTIKITNVSVDNMNQNINFNVQSGPNPSLQTSIYGSASLSDCIKLSQGEIVDLIWTRAASQCANWLIYVNRTDLNLSSLNGTTYTPSNLTIPFPQYTMPMPMMMPPMP